MPKVTKDNASIELKKGTELLRIPHLDPAFPLKFGCCQGMCGTCAIKLSKGKEHLSPPTKQELETLRRLRLESHRLACQCALLGDVVIEHIAS